VSYQLGLCSPNGCRLVYYSSKKMWEKGDALREEESPRHQDHYPKETTLKLENSTFTKATIYFSNAISK
jgi:hypothetical protein